MEREIDRYHPKDNGDLSGEEDMEGMDDFEQD